VANFLESKDVGYTLAMSTVLGLLKGGAITPSALGVDLMMPLVGSLDRLLMPPSLQPHAGRSAAAGAVSGGGSSSSSSSTQSLRHELEEEHGIIVFLNGIPRLCYKQGRPVPGPMVTQPALVHPHEGRPGHAQEELGPHQISHLRQAGADAGELLSISVYPYALADEIGMVRPQVLDGNGRTVMPPFRASDELLFAGCSRAECRPEMVLAGDVFPPARQGGRQQQGSGISSGNVKQGPRPSTRPAAARLLSSYPSPFNAHSYLNRVYGGPNYWEQLHGLESAHVVLSDSDLADRYAWRG
jgi:hypothetical protein